MWRVLVLLAGCGRIGFAPLSAGSAADGAPVTYHDAVLADHPLAYWRLDDIGTTAGDVMGTYPGTYSGACMHGILGALADEAAGGTGDYARHDVVTEQEPQLEQRFAQ